MTSYDSGSTIYEMQTTIPASDLDQKLQLLHERLGDCTLIDELLTVYEHRKISIKVSDPLNSTDNVHTVVSLGKYKQVQDKPVTMQHAVISTVEGDPHAFFRSLGCKPSHLWIEKGHLFKHGSLTIKIFQVLTYDSKPFDENFFGVSIQEHIPLVEMDLGTQENIVQHLTEFYKFLCSECSPYLPHIHRIGQL